MTISKKMEPIANENLNLLSLHPGDELLFNCTDSDSDEENWIKTNVGCIHITSLEPLQGNFHLTIGRRGHICDIHQARWITEYNSEFQKYKFYLTNCPHGNKNIPAPKFYSIEVPKPLCLNQKQS